MDEKYKLLEFGCQRITRGNSVVTIKVMSSDEIKTAHVLNEKTTEGVLEALRSIIMEKCIIKECSLGASFQNGSKEKVKPDKIIIDMESEGEIYRGIGESFDLHKAFAKAYIDAINQKYV